MNDVITTEKLSKRYKDVLAVSEISLNVRKGEIYGFLGLNGAGKTTTIRMLLGMINPICGSSFINGQKVHPNNTSLWKEIGYLVEIPYSYPDLTVKENLEIIRRLRFISDKTVVSSIIDRLKLTQYANRKAKNLSLGNAQRLGLAKALIHNPNILILDEPTNGLDPAGIYEIRELLNDLAKNQGVTIFISSHILGEISRFSTRIGIIHDGVLIQEIDTLQLEELCQKRLIVNTKDNITAKKILTENGFSVKDTSSEFIEITDNSAINQPENIASLLVNKGSPPSLLNVVEEDLESYFLRTIGMKGDRL
ncbi:MAG TPA: bacitracin ABC transporter ATP-binding protein [Bacteroidales bacterium]|nr:MAG: bacitracin ABC transporter ATP-binding protein [Bacteroidetes bacterium GWF2_35_48]OFZ06251.1 MAG: bacitracin ABC transporter ATP-binding protein [Bacteroidetes bacterium RIFOXYC12_FULL_35_7]HBX51967.1 bacitracin ABC transporter ATP-binding protein [Bacteroidales bacterium]